VIASTGFTCGWESSIDVKVFVPNYVVVPIDLKANCVPTLNIWLDSKQELV
jgi:hypothetical protein